MLTNREAESIKQMICDKIRVHPADLAELCDVYDITSEQFDEFLDDAIFQVNYANEVEGR